MSINFMIFVVSAFSLIFFLLGHSFGAFAERQSHQAKEAAPVADADEEYMTPCEADGHHIVQTHVNGGEQLPLGSDHYCTKCGITLYDIWEERKREVRQ